MLGATHPNLVRREGETYRRSLQERVARWAWRTESSSSTASWPRRSSRLADGCRHLRDAIPEPRSDRLGHARLRDERRSGNRLDAVCVCDRASEPDAGGSWSRARRPHSPPPLSNSCAMTSSVWPWGGWPTCTLDRWSGPGRRAVQASVRARGNHGGGGRRRHRRNQCFPCLTPRRCRHRCTRSTDATWKCCSDELGIWQHASAASPDPAFGFCTDDVSRALTVDLFHSRESVGPPSPRASTAIWRSSSEAEGGSGRRFRNFRAADGAWLEVEGSEDCHGRAPWRASPRPSSALMIHRMVEAARRLFERALPAARELYALRATASALLACDGAVRGGRRASRRQGDPPASRGPRDSRPLRTDLAGTPDWRWPEPILTYENALPPRALIVAGDHLGARIIRDTVAGPRLADRRQTSPPAVLPGRNKGWWPRDGVEPVRPAADRSLRPRSRRSRRLHGDRRVHYLRAMELAYGWFLGVNDGGTPVAVAAAAEPVSTRSRPTG